MQKPRVVVTIHGIRTRGAWQKTITPFLAMHGLVPYHIDYGWFRAFAFLVPFARERQIRKLRTELRDLVSRLGTPRINVIAHSFGTMVASEILKRENGNIRYDRVVLSGCILPCDYDWESLFAAKLVMAVRNERATSDWVVSLAQLASRAPLKWFTWLAAGDSGRKPFTKQSPALLDTWIEGDHSETHNPIKFDQWARFIAYPSLPDDIRDRVRTELQALRQAAARMLDEDPDRVRVNLFAPLQGELQIVPGATDNMTYAPEFDIHILENHGGTGTAYSTGDPCIVVRHGASWSGNTLPGDQLKLVHPGLKWVISLPIVSKTRKVVTGVVNVDGLDNIPTLVQDPRSEESRAAAVALYFAAVERFEPLLEAAFRGDPAPSIEV